MMMIMILENSRDSAKATRKWFHIRVDKCTGCVACLWDTTAQTNSTCQTVHIHTTHQESFVRWLPACWPFTLLRATLTNPDERLLEYASQRLFASFSSSFSLSPHAPSTGRVHDTVLSVPVSTYHSLPWYPLRLCLEGKRGKDKQDPRLSPESGEGEVMHVVGYLLFAL
jgi:hypothetical protein